METIRIKDNLFGDVEIGPHDIEVKVNLRNGGYKAVKICWETMWALSQQFPEYTQDQLIVDAYKKAAYELLGK